MPFGIDPAADVAGSVVLVHMMMMMMMIPLIGVAKYCSKGILHDDYDDYMVDNDMIWHIWYSECTAVQKSREF